jgi:hypothetical protein
MIAHLAIVARKVEVMQCMVRGRVDESLEEVARDHVAVVDEDGPDLDEDEEDEVEVLLHGADEDEDAGGISAGRRGR